MPKRIITKDTKTLQVIISFIKTYPKKIPKIGIRYATWVWKTRPLTVKILNLINQANPVATTPKYNKDKVDNKVGFEFQGVSKTIEKGNKNITDHKVVEVVTFSLSLFLSFKVNKPPIQ